MHLSFHWSFTYHFIFSWNNIFMYLSIVHCCSFVKDLSFSIFTNQSILLSYSQKLLKVYILLLILVTLVTPLPFIYCTLFLIFIHVSLLFAFFISRLCVIYYVHISFQCISDVRILLHTFILMPLFYVFMKYPKWHVDSASFSCKIPVFTAHPTISISNNVKSFSYLLFLISLCTVCQSKPMCASMPGLHKIRRTCHILKHQAVITTVRHVFIKG